MRVDSITIATPYDNPVDYQPDWRHQIAVAMVDTGCIVDLKPGDTAIISRHMRFLKYDKRVVEDEQRKTGSAVVKHRFKVIKPCSMTQEMADHKLVFTWYADEAKVDAFKHYIDALLLTECSYGGIADYLGVPETQVQLYEQLFYNVRCEGRSDKLLRFRFSAAGRINTDGETAKHADWKRVAAQLGYRALLSSWGNGVTDDIGTQRDLYGGASGVTAIRIVRGEISNFDINGIAKNYNDRVKVENERLAAGLAHGAGGNSASTDVAWKAFLSDFAPAMVEVVESEEDKTKLQEGLKNKLLAQRNIDGVVVGDKGPGSVSEFTGIIKQKLSGG